MMHTCINDGKGYCLYCGEMRIFDLRHTWTYINEAGNIVPSEYRDDSVWDIVLIESEKNEALWAMRHRHYE